MSSKNRGKRKEKIFLSKKEYDKKIEPDRKLFLMGLISRIDYRARKKNIAEKYTKK